MELKAGQKTCLFVSTKCMFQGNSKAYDVIILEPLAHQHYLIIVFFTPLLIWWRIFVALTLQEKRSDTSLTSETLAINEPQVKLKYWTFQFYAILLLIIVL